MLKGQKLRIYPNAYQKELIEFNFGANRFVWNQMLDMLIKGLGTSLSKIALTATG